MMKNALQIVLLCAPLLYASASHVRVDETTRRIELTSPGYLYNTKTKRYIGHTRSNGYISLDAIRTPEDALLLHTVHLLHGERQYNEMRTYTTRNDIHDGVRNSIRDNMRDSVRDSVRYSARDDVRDGIEDMRVDVLTEEFSEKRIGLRPNASTPLYAFTYIGVPGRRTRFRIVSEGECVVVNERYEVVLSLCSRNKKQEDAWEWIDRSSYLEALMERKYLLDGKSRILDGSIDAPIRVSHNMLLDSPHKKRKNLSYDLPRSTWLRRRQENVCLVEKQLHIHCNLEEEEISNDEETKMLLDRAIERARRYAPENQEIDTSREIIRI
ncbi:hypothetical protein NEFER03_2027 [Nematocida sp. LUAm3]|nr:hypothetical protein NEFER03_2027 [Nematocida sp. LUAm3]KAI5174501.1 hypothetical protein NEFER02_0622 [Nematocida sp. LUAm2]KAI5179152.1 hypothetical protein NEFER01_2015 [Nematocida sp. LUAm1]